MAHHEAPFLALNRMLELPNTVSGSIAKACAAVEQCVTNNRDNLRALFEVCFPTLLRRIFGYDTLNEASWLNMVAKPGREQDAKALMDLLSPTGKLFGAIMSADADQLIQFIFPLQRLPGHTQELLKAPAGRAELERWPQYRGHITTDASGRPQVLLGVFEFYMFWNAFYVLRGGRAASDVPYPGAGAAAGAGAARSDSHWGRSVYDIARMGTSLIPGLHGSHAVTLLAHPYFTLLDQYLHQFLPQTGQASAGLGVGSSYGMGYGASKPGLSQGATLLSVLIEFWLTDAAEPLPLAPPITTPTTPLADPTSSPQPTPSGLISPGTAGVAAGMVAGMVTPVAAAYGVARGGASPGVLPVTSPLRVMSFQPPSEEVLLGITQLVRHVHVRAEPARAAGRGAGIGASAAQAGAPWLVETPIQTVVAPLHGLARGAGTAPLMAGAVVGLIGPPACPAVQAVSRKVYRFLRRAIAQWPHSSNTSLLPLINLWLTVITPWAANTQPTSTTTGGAPPPGTSQGGAGGSQGGGVTKGMTLGAVGSEISHMLHLSRPATEAGLSGAAQAGPPYTSEWRGHVLAHLPFYHVLIPRFLELIYTRLSFRGDAAASELLLLLRSLASAGPELIKLLREAEQTVTRYRESHKKRVAGPLADIVPWWCDQTLDWEAAAVAGAPTNPPMQAEVDFRLFSVDNNSAAFFGAAVLRAANTQVRQDLREPLISAMTAVLPLSDMPTNQPAAPQPLQGGQGATHYPPAGNWRHLHYKGDWMKRPIASNEIPALVRLTVRVSELLNRLVGLDKPWQGDEQEEPPENVVTQGLAWMRKKGYRISLRPLAEVQVVGWLVGIYLLLWMCGVFSGTARGAAGPVTQGQSPGVTMHVTGDVVM